MGEIKKKDLSQFIWLPFVKGSIPMTPVAKGRPRSTKAGHTYTPAKTKQAEGIIRLYLRNKWKNEPVSGIVGLRVTFVSPRPKRLKGTERELRPKKPDTDNLYKLFCDGANGILYKDDAILCMHHMMDWYAAKEEDPKIIFEASVPKSREEALKIIMEKVINDHNIYTLANDMGLSWRTLHRYRKNPYDNCISERMRREIEHHLLSYDVTHSLF